MLHVVQRETVLRKTVLFATSSLGIDIKSRPDGKGCVVSAVSEGSGREDLVGRRVLKLSGEYVGEKSEQELRPKIVRASVGTLPLKMMFGAAPAVAKALDAERAKPPTEESKEKIRRGDVIYGVEGKEFPTNCTREQVVQRILEAKAEVGENFVKLMVARPDQLFKNGKPIYREEMFNEVVIRASEAGQQLRLGIDLGEGQERRVTAVVEGQAKSQGVKVGNVLTRVAEVDIAGEDLDHEGVVALVAQKAKEVGAGGLGLEFCTVAPDPKLLVHTHRQASAKVKELAEQHFTTALFGQSSATDTAFHADYTAGWCMSGNGAVMSQPSFDDGLALYSVASDAKVPFVTLPFNEVSVLHSGESCTFGCLSHDGSNVVLGGESGFIAYTGKYEAAKGNETNLVAVAMRENKAVLTVMRAGPPGKAEKTYEGANWTLKKLAMPSMDRVVAVWRVANEKIGNEKIFEWVVARYEIIAYQKAQTNRYVRCGIKEAGWFALPKGEVGADIPNGQYTRGECLRLLVSARVVSRSSITGLSTKTDGEMIAVAAATKEGTGTSEVMRWKLVVREWAANKNKSSEAATVPPVAGRVEHVCCSDADGDSWYTPLAMSSTADHGGVLVAVGDYTASSATVYDCKVDAKVAVLQLESAVRAVWLSEDGAYLVVGAGGKLTVFGVGSQRVLRSLDAAYSDRNLWVSRDCSVVVAGGKTLRLQGGMVAPVTFAKQARDGTIRSVRAAGECSAVAAALYKSDGVGNMDSISLGDGGMLVGVAKTNVYIYQPGSKWARLGSKGQSQNFSQVAVGSGCIYGREKVVEGGKWVYRVYKMELGAGGDYGQGKWTELCMDVAVGDGGKDVKEGSAAKLNIASISTTPSSSIVYGTSEDHKVYRHGGRTEDRWVRMGMKTKPADGGEPHDVSVYRVSVGVGCVYGLQFERVEKNGRLEHVSRMYKMELGAGVDDGAGVWTKLCMELVSELDCDNSYGPIRVQFVDPSFIVTAPDGSCVYGWSNNGKGVFKHSGGPHDKWVKAAPALADSVCLGLQPKQGPSAVKGEYFALVVGPEGLYAGFTMLRREGCAFPPPQSEVYRFDGQRWVLMGIGQTEDYSCSVHVASEPRSKDIIKAKSSRGPVSRVELSDDGKHVVVVSCEPFDLSSATISTSTPIVAVCVGEIELNEGGKKRKVEVQRTEAQVVLSADSACRAVVCVKNTSYTCEGRLDAKTGKLTGKLYAARLLTNPSDSDGKSKGECDIVIGTACTFRVTVYSTSDQKQVFSKLFPRPPLHVNLRSKPLQLATVAGSTLSMYGLQKQGAESCHQQEWDRAKLGLDVLRMCWCLEGASVLLRHDSNAFSLVKVGSEGGAVLSTTVALEGNCSGAEVSPNGEFLAIKEEDKLVNSTVKWNTHDTNVHVYKIGSHTALATFRHVGHIGCICVGNEGLVAVVQAATGEEGKERVLVHDARNSATVCIFNSAFHISRCSLEANSSGKSVLVAHEGYSGDGVKTVRVFPVGGVVTNGSTAGMVQWAMTKLLDTDVVMQSLVPEQVKKNWALVSSIAATCAFTSSALLHFVLDSDLSQQRKRELLLKLLRVKNEGDEEKAFAPAAAAASSENMLFEMSGSSPVRARRETMPVRAMQKASKLKRTLSTRGVVDGHDGGGSTNEQTSTSSPLALAIQTRQEGCVQVLLDAAAQTAPINGRVEVARNMTELIRRYPVLTEKFLNSLALTKTENYVMGHELPGDRRIPYVKIGLVGSDACAPIEGDLWHLGRVLPLWFYVLRYLTHENAFCEYFREEKKKAKRMQGCKMALAGCIRRISCQKAAKEATIRLTRPLSLGIGNNFHHLHIRQIVAYSTAGEKLLLTPSKTPTNPMGPHPGNSAEQAIDGNYISDDTNYHSNCTDSNKNSEGTQGKEDLWLEYVCTLAAGTELGIIKIWNRGDGNCTDGTRKHTCNERINGSHLTVYTGDSDKSQTKELLARFELEGTKREYTFALKGCQLEPDSVALLESLDLAPAKVAAKPKRVERARVWWVCVRTMLGIEEVPLNEEEVTPYVIDLEGFAGDKIIGALARSKCLNLFETKAAEHLIEWKWNNFGIKVHGFLMCVYLVFLVAFSVWAYLVLHNENSHDGVTEIWAYVTTGLAGFFLLLEVAQLYHQGPLVHFTDPLNWLDAGAASITLYLTTYWFAGDEHEQLKRAFTVASCLVCLRFLTYLRPLPQTGSFIGMVFHVMYDMGPFLVILFIVVLAFALSFYHLHAFSTDGDTPFKDALFGAYTMMLGELYTDDEALDSFEGRLLESVYVLIGLIVMLNLLIAIISDTYEKVKEKEVAQFLFERACLIVEYEANLKLVASLTCGWIPLDKWFRVDATWLHVLKRSEGADNGTKWGGRTRALKHHINRQNKRLVAQVAKMEANQAAMETKIEANQAAMGTKMDQIIAMLELAKGQR
jgi:hypothetical protein